MPSMKGWIQKELLLKNYIGTLSTVCIKKKDLLKVGGLDENFPSNQDLDLYLRVAAITKTAYVDKSLVLVRRHHNDRISLNMTGKLIGNRMLWDKYAELINSDHRLRHRAASRVFIYAVNTFNILEIRRSIKLTLSGAFYDLRNLIWVFKETISLLVKRKVNNFLEFKTANMRKKN